MVVLGLGFRLKLSCVYCARHCLEEPVEDTGTAVLPNGRSQCCCSASRIAIIADKVLPRCCRTSTRARP